MAGAPSLRRPDQHGCEGDRKGIAYRLASHTVTLAEQNY